MGTDAGVESFALASIDSDLAHAVGALLARVWPKPGKDAAYRARQLVEIGQGYEGPVKRTPRVFVVRDARKVIAAATMKPRTIRIGEGAGAVELTIMGLALVGSDPERRGEKLGARVVTAAFEMIDQGAAPFALFQTSHKVRPFYEQLGACLVENRVVSSLADDPSANPFWDDVVMRYPAHDQRPRQSDWPAGTIDLLGPGY